jgi:hypothetical protein
VNSRFGRLNTDFGKMNTRFGAPNTNSGTVDRFDTVDALTVR